MTVQRAAIVILFATFVLGSIAATFIITSTPPPEQLRESVDYNGFEGERSSEWRSVRNAFVVSNPVCEACGSDDDLNVHHIKPFHKSPELELEWDNLITLCREHHFTIGHDPDGPWGPKKPNWKSSNSNVRRDAKKYSLELAP